jgi:hypothetical protein
VLIVFEIIDNAMLFRINMGIDNCISEIIIIYNVEAPEFVLKHISPYSIQFVETFRIGNKKILDGLFVGLYPCVNNFIQRGIFFYTDNKMIMIGHQAPCINFKILLGVEQKSTVEEIVVSLLPENIFTVLSPVEDVVEIVRL